jgi:hypothetical protein
LPEDAEYHQANHKTVEDHTRESLFVPQHVFQIPLENFFELNAKAGSATCCEVFEVGVNLIVSLQVSDHVLVDGWSKQFLVLAHHDWQSQIRVANLGLLGHFDYVIRWIGEPLDGATQAVL